MKKLFLAIIKRIFGLSKQAELNKNLIIVAQEHQMLIQALQIRVNVLQERCAILEKLITPEDGLLLDDNEAFIVVSVDDLDPLDEDDYEKTDDEDDGKGYLN